MSTVNEKLTAIADAIRMYTGGAEPLTLDAMAEGIHIGNTYTKEHYLFEGRILGFEEGKASVQEVHRHTVPSDQTSGTYTFLANNEFIKNNYTKDGLCIQIFYLPPYKDGNGASYAYTGNIAIPSISTGEATKNSFMLNVRDDGTFRVRVDANVPYFDESGNLLMTTSTTNGILKAGDYLIILSVAEV